MEQRLLVCLLFAVLGTFVRAADFSGTWRADVARGDGVSMQTYFVLHQEGAALDGKVVSGGIDLPVRHPHFEGGDAVFGTDWNWNYRLHSEGTGLRVTITYLTSGRLHTDEGVAVRVPEAEANPPPPLPLPALEPVPANGLARTPPMGWNSWNHFMYEVNDQVVRETADALVRTGLAAAGYVYVNIDDSWEGSRDAQGNIHSNVKFPDMKALADYVHQRGLKLGLYSSPGPFTCGGYAGSYGHEEQDAKTYAAWGIDYLKYDW